MEFAKQGGLRTKDRRERSKAAARQERGYRWPTFNLAIARGYLSAHDAKNEHAHVDGCEMGTHGIA